MADDNTTYLEPEEAIESAICAKIAACATIPVEGVLTPANVGAVKSLTSDTFISVAVDQASQMFDYTGENAPYTFSVRISVHYAMTDDASGTSFRDECRRVRKAIVALTGDGCINLGAENFNCDGFVCESTSTSFDGGDNPVNTKTYSVTITGRVCVPMI